MEGRGRTDEPASRSTFIRSGRARGPIVLAVVAGIAAVVIGSWVDRTWPNPVYGMQVIALGVALLFVLIGLAVLRHGPVGESIAAASLSALLGVVVGMTVFGAPDPQHATGTMRLTLQQPIVATLTGDAACVSEGDRLAAWAEFGRPPIEGVDVLRVGLDQGYPPDDELLARADGRNLWIILENTQTEGPPGLSAFATQDTLLTGHLGPLGGSLRFAQMQTEPDAPGAPKLRVREFAGSMDWTCTAETDR